MADVDAKVWDLVALEGVESSADPFGQGGEPPPDPASWNLPATLSVQQSGNIPLRQYAVNATGWTISVSGLPTGVTYNASLERLEGASTGTASGTATFTLSLSGQADVVDTATVSLVEMSDPFAAAIWYDDFNYVAPRAALAGSTDNPFVNNGPWSFVKSQEFWAGAVGYIYTVDPTTDIPGNSINPSLTSSRVVCMESLSGTLQGQSDFYLDRNAALDDDVLPADVWIQQWVYVARAGDQMSQFAGHAWKWLYPCRDGHGSCSTMGFLLSVVPNSHAPLCAGGGENGVYLYDLGDENRNDIAAINGNTGAGCSDGAWKKGVSNAGYYVPFNTWVLLKIHYNHSGPQGVWEMWARIYGQSNWVKWADWRGGVTPAGFTWDIPEARRRGHNNLRWPTTTSSSNGPHYNGWIYSADFVVAASEANLPVYSDGD